MGTQYQVDAVNDSSEMVAFCLHQRDPDGGYRAMPVAWLVRPCPPASRTVFSWTTDLSFVWGEVDRVRPGAVFRASGSLTARPDSPESQAVFDDRGGYRLDRDQSSAPPGRLVVRTEASIPSGCLAIGIGMSGNATTVSDARPNMGTSFSPRQEYWLAAGRFEDGEVLDPDGVADATQVTFPAGVSTLTATYGADRRWKVVPA